MASDGLTLIGTLGLAHRASDRVRPSLVATAWHPVEGRWASAPWPDRGAILDAAVRLDDGPPPVVLRLDPRSVADHNRVILEHAARVRRWLRNGLKLAEYQAPPPEPGPGAKRPGRPRKRPRATPAPPARRRPIEAREMTLATLPVDVPVLAGRLVMHRRGAVKGRPTLICSAWCPHCRDEHGAEWGDPPIDDPTRVVIIAAPCEAGPFAGGDDRPRDRPGPPSRGEPDGHPCRRGVEAMAGGAEARRGLGGGFDRGLTVGPGRGIAGRG